MKTAKLMIISSHFRLSGGWLNFKLRKPEEIREYIYHTEEKTIILRHPGDDSALSYRVEHIRRNTYWLHLLEDVECEPDDYYFKLKIRIITALSPARS